MPSVSSKGPRFVFVTGGVVSSIGKGIAAASLAVLLQDRGLKVRLRKLDPYLNIDAGTMSPYQHGEVYVTDDGAETDLDLGYYERFTGVSATKADSITAGYVYRSILERERQGLFLGHTVQVVPHVTSLIREKILAGTDGEDVVICEIGGTVGDIEGMAFLEAIRQLALSLGPSRSMFLHVTLLPWIASAGEMKTKPTQQSVSLLQGYGIRPDVLLCRCEHRPSDAVRRKIALFCNLDDHRVIAAPDVSSVYDVPLELHSNGLDKVVLDHFGLALASRGLANWRRFVEARARRQAKVRVALVGKYVGLMDSYKSVVEALDHAAVSQGLELEVDAIDSEAVPEQEILRHLAEADGVLVPGGFGARGTEGKVAAIAHARTSGLPFLGICLGMQLAVIEFARSVVGLVGAGSTEFDEPAHPVVALMTEWSVDGGVQKRSEADGVGGTMRLGAYESVLVESSAARRLYGDEQIWERHRHRYEVNAEYVGRLSAAGLDVTGWSADGSLPEVVELRGHPFFLACQFHPEFTSRPLSPHPLFSGFIAACAGRPGEVGTTVAGGAADAGME